jgi:predicted MFS family arabinose efflux permease
MATLRKWLNAHKFQMHALAFGVMILTPMLMYITAQGETIVWIWILLALFAAGNFLALSVP